MGTATIIRSPAVSGLTTAPLLKRDPILRGDTAAEILFLAELGWDWCFDQDTAITNGELVNDIAEVGNGSFVVTGTAPTFAGGGVDFSATDTAGNYLMTPASVAAAISANGQNFFQWAYFKMPADANWWTTVGDNNSLINWSPSASYLSQDDICSFFPKTSGGTVKQLLTRFQTGAGAASSVNFSPVPADMPGNICQIAAWRTTTALGGADQLGASIRTPTVRVTNTAARTTNAQPISALQARVGCHPVWNTLDANELAALGDLRLYRAGFGTPKTGGRSIPTVLEQDYLNCIGRFS